MGVLLRLGGLGRLVSSSLRRVGLAPGARGVNGLSLVGTSSVKVRLRDASRVSPGAAKGAGENIVAQARGLDGESLAHDGAAASNDLQVAHGAATRSRSVLDTGAGGHGAQGGGRGLVQERTHGPGLAEEGLHGGGGVQRGGGVCCSGVVVLQRRRSWEGG